MNSAKTIVSMSAMMLSLGSAAQEVTWFEAEGSVYYQVAGCTPGSDILYYSQMGGGKMILNTATDSQGRSSVQEVMKFKPAAVLNTKYPNSNGIAGTGKLLYINEKEFALRNIDVEQKDGLVNLTWEASATSADMTFVVLKSNDGANYEAVEKITGNTGTGIQKYRFTDDKGAGFYKISVTRGSNEIRYTSRTYKIQQGLKIYPTTAIAYVRISLEQSGNSSSYKIINETGQVVKDGTLTAVETNLLVQDLAPGNYFVLVENIKGVLTGRFVKL